MFKLETLSSLCSSQRLLLTFYNRRIVNCLLFDSIICSMFILRKMSRKSIPSYSTSQSRTNNYKEEVMIFVIVPTASCHVNFWILLYISLISSFFPILVAGIPRLGLELREIIIPLLWTYWDLVLKTCLTCVVRSSLKMVQMLADQVVRYCFCSCLVKNISIASAFVCNLISFHINLVKFIHSKSFLHWDIKPDNFLMGLERRPNQVPDFVSYFKDFLALFTCLF